MLSDLPPAASTTRKPMMSAQQDLMQSSSSTLKPLSVPIVEQAIDSATLVHDKEREVPRWLEQNMNLRIQPIKDWRPILKESRIDAEEFLATKTPWYFGMSITNTQTNEVVGMFTFYVAYSSWNGRILYVDRLDKCSGKEQEDGEEEVERLLLRILAQIALDLDCARITWRHITTPGWHSKGDNQPEMHGEVLTLSMDEAAMTEFLLDSPLSSVKPVVPVQGEAGEETGSSPFFGRELIEAAFDSCLEKINNNIKGSPFRLRLAKKKDLDTMTRLVQGLADYCEESDAVHMKANDYIQDGFELDNPLWYCLLVDKECDNKDGKTTKAYYTCGYAFIFIGCIMGEGRFMYLEDLYLEVEHRGGGGGGTVMKTLAGLCRAMNCSRLYWQALDWNSAGLSFYEKIGAKIHPGEKTSRYGTDALKRFAMEACPDSSP